MSLWLGISAIDLKAIFEILVDILHNFATKVMSIFSLNDLGYGLVFVWYWFGLENLFDLMVKHTKILRSKIKIQFEKLLSFIHLIFIYFVNWIH